MFLSDFNYMLPKELIAQSPLRNRDSSRLLVLERKTQQISHRTIKDLAQYLRPHDVIVLNNTKVIPARLFGHKKDTHGKVDALLVKRLSTRRFKVLLRPALKIGQVVIFERGGIKASLVDKEILEFSRPLSLNALNRFGSMPLPPYIKRRPRKSDSLRYQTVYAKKPGAIAAPTAGLHFTNKLLEEIKNKNAKVNYLMLHVGLGTFKPVVSEDISKHAMDREEFSIPKATIRSIASAKNKGNRIFAVGTTTTRALEATASWISNNAAKYSSVVFDRGSVPQSHGEPDSLSSPRGKSYTNLFIYPGYEFKVVDCLLTNFHLPKTTLFMLVCALAGRDLIMRAYQEAIKEKYRFYSYGDAMLII